MNHYNELMSHQDQILTLFYLKYHYFKKLLEYFLFMLIFKSIFFCYIYLNVNTGIFVDYNVFIICKD